MKTLMQMVYVTDFTAVGPDKLTYSIDARLDLRAPRDYPEKAQVWDIKVLDVYLVHPSTGEQEKLDYHSYFEIGKLDGKAYVAKDLKRQVENEVLKDADEHLVGGSIEDDENY
jgi:hypothetical protein